MTVLTKTRGALTAARIITVDNTGRQILGTPYGNTIGDEQTIVSEYSGKFEPGRFRVNPVTITRSVGSCTSSSTPKTRHPTIPSIYYQGYGPIAACCNWASGRNSGYLDGSWFGSWMKGKSVVDAYCNLQEADWDAGLFAAELKETLGMLRNPASAFVKLVKQVRKNSPHRWKQILNGTAGSWLEGRYGWTPLINDIQSAISYLVTRDLTKALGPLERVSGRTKATKEYTLEYRVPILDYTMWATWKVDYSYQMKCVTRMYYILERSRTLAEQLGLTAGALPSIAWEKVPFSFVMDWFVGVGSWLQTLQPIPHVSIKGNSCSYKVSEVVRSNLIKVEPYNGYVTVVAPHGSVFSWNQVKLIRVKDYPLPLLPVVNPEMTSVKHMLDSLCLIWQKNSKLLRRR